MSARTNANQDAIKTRREIIADSMPQIASNPDLGHWINFAFLADKQGGLKPFRNFLHFDTDAHKWCNNHLSLHIGAFN